jgi:hypothetical protein
MTKENHEAAAMPDLLAAAVALGQKAGRHGGAGLDSATTTSLLEPWRPSPRGFSLRRCLSFSGSATISPTQVHGALQPATNSAAWCQDSGDSPVPDPCMKPPSLDLGYW